MAYTVEGYRERVAARFKFNLQPLTESEFKAKNDELRIWWDTKRVLGQGAYGSVYPGLWFYRGMSRRPIEIVVKKQLDGEPMDDADRVVTEVNLSLRLAHIHLPRTFFVFGPIISDDPASVENAPHSRYDFENGFDTLGLYIIMERYHGSDLEHYVLEIGQYLEEHENGLLYNVTPRQPVALIKIVMNQLLEALDYLFKQYITHQDIAPRNVLFDRHGTVKLIDMGLAEDMRQHVPAGQEPQIPEGVTHPELLPEPEPQPVPEPVAVSKETEQKHSEVTRPEVERSKSTSKIEPKAKPKKSRVKVEEAEEAFLSLGGGGFDSRSKEEQQRAEETITSHMTPPTPEERRDLQAEISKDLARLKVLEAKRQDRPHSKQQQETNSQDRQATTVFDIPGTSDDDEDVRRRFEEFQKRVAAQGGGARPKQKHTKAVLEETHETKSSKSDSTVYYDFESDEEEEHPWGKGLSKEDYLAQERANRRKSRSTSKSKTKNDTRMDSSDDEAEVEDALVWQEKINRKHKSGDKDQPDPKEPKNLQRHRMADQEDDPFANAKRDFGVSDQDKYPPGARTPPPDPRTADDYSRWLTPYRADCTWSRDLYDLSTILVYMIGDSDRMEYYLWYTQMIRFYKALKNMADGLHFNPIPQLLDHPWLRFDPLEILYRQKSA